ncbi:diguanylate cyclase domain-containing protein [Noviherbaspirillum sp. ST9]|uniref:diguanylate cyclase domain-containing protein n=1 Tax=Noviherbaspirillum sp. ST9 TaxID=3401606 RepID=UPI003B587B96
MNVKPPATLPNIVDLLLDAVFLVDTGGRIVYVSAACEGIFGYTPDEMIGMEMINLVVPEDRARTIEESGQVSAGRPRIGFENRYIRKDGSQVHLMWSARWSEADQLRIGVARNITERKRAEDMQTATYAISEAAHGANDFVDMFREIHRIITRLVPTAGFAVALRDGSAAEFSQPYETDVSGDPNVRRLFIDVIRTRRTVVHETERQADGRMESWIGLPLVLPAGVSGALILKSHPGTRYADKDRELLQFVSTQVAIAVERRRLNDELRRAARYDELTGLPNRRLFQDRMKSALARTRRHGGRIALLYVDIDDFKQINDSLGHTAGDQLLGEVAHRLQQCVREEDTVARLGGDEFVVLLEEISTPDDAQLVSTKITATINQPVHLDGSLLCVHPSIGIAVYPDDGETAEQLLKHADMRMYEMKKARSPGA